MQQDQHSKATSKPRAQDRPNAEQIAASIKEQIEGQNVSAATEALAHLRPADQADAVSRLSHDVQRILLGEMQPRRTRCVDRSVGAGESRVAVSGNGCGAAIAGS